MSMTSKVNPTLRQEIINYLAKNPNSGNTDILFSYPYFRDCYFGSTSYPSMRTIQEATQKLTKDGTLVRVGNKFSVAPATTLYVTARHRVHAG